MISIENLKRQGFGELLPLDESTIETLVNFKYKEDEIRRIIFNHIEKNTGVKLLYDDLSVEYIEDIEENISIHCFNFKESVLDTEIEKDGEVSTLRECIEINTDSLESFFKEVLLEEFANPSYLSVELYEGYSGTMANIYIPVKHFL